MKWCVRRDVCDVRFGVVKLADGEAVEDAENADGCADVEPEWVATGVVLDADGPELRRVSLISGCVIIREITRIDRMGQKGQTYISTKNLNASRMGQSQSLPLIRQDQNSQGQ